MLQWPSGPPSEVSYSLWKKWATTFPSKHFGGHSSALWSQPSFFRWVRECFPLLFKAQNHLHSMVHEGSTIIKYNVSIFLRLINAFWYTETGYLVTRSEKSGFLMYLWAHCKIFQNGKRLPIMFSNERMAVGSTLEAVWIFPMWEYVFEFWMTEREF